MDQTPEMKAEKYELECRILGEDIDDRDRFSDWTFYAVRSIVNESDKKDDVIETLIARLAATEVQRDAALAACKLLLTIYPDDEFGKYNQAVKLLEIVGSPQQAASVIEQRDRLRDLLETMVSISPYGQEWRAVCQEAREALKGEGT